MVHAILILLAALGGARAADLFRDNFARLPAGPLSAPVGTLNGAIQEYHYLPHRGVDTAPWVNALCHQDAWIVSSENGTPYLEQHLVNDRAAYSNPLFITGDEEWADYTVEVSVKPLSPADMAGVAFRYRHNRHYYLFAVTGGGRAVLKVRQPLEERFRAEAWRELASVPFPYDCRRYLRLRVVNQGPRIQASIDGKLVLEASDRELLKGKIGLTANIPARFADVHVTVDEQAQAALEKRIALREAELARLRAGNPQPKLWRKFDTPGYGVGRNLRLGDLDGDSVPDLLLAQNIHRVRGDAFVQISCLTAVTLDGRILWQQGKPDPRNGLLTNDTPFQIHDLDGDGRNEVVLVRDFQLQVLQGRTGKPLRSVWMPEMDPSLKERPYRYHNGDAIAFLDLAGRGRPRAPYDHRRRSEIMVKDRYRTFWIFDSTLRLLWQGTGQTGHYPFPWDLDGDGREEFALGYALWSPNGQRQWSHDEALRDHADGIVIANLSPNPDAPPRVYACGSDEGFLMFSASGELLKHVRIGHAQSPSIAKYRPDVPGLQLLTVNYWYNPGILSLFDWEGNLLEQGEPIHTGSPLLPVNWRGDGVELSMLSPHPREGGLIDGHFRRVVQFPDDGHPNLAYYVADVTGDVRDEILVWDTERVWIYTQDRPFQGKRIYAPVRNPHANESNYRTTVSLPGWRDVR